MEIHESLAIDQCLFSRPSEITTVEELNDLFQTHDWELVRKDGYSKLSVLIVMRCKRCQAERVCSLSSMAHHSRLSE